jgi:hypothetical protein
MDGGNGWRIISHRQWGKSGFHFNIVGCDGYRPIESIKNKQN